MFPKLFELGKKDIEARSQGFAQGERLEGTKFVSSPRGRERKVDAVKVKKLADPVPGSDDVLLNSDQRPACLSAFSSLLVGHVTGILEVMVLYVEWEIDAEHEPRDTEPRHLKGFRLLSVRYCMSCFPYKMKYWTLLRGKCAGLLLST